jgi:hypothetical protein
MLIRDIVNGAGAECIERLKFAADTARFPRRSDRWPLAHTVLSESSSGESGVHEHRTLAERTGI